MKNIIIVTKGNNAVGLGDDNKPAVTKTVLNSAFLAGLETLIEMMNGVADTPAETSHFYLPDTLQGIITGASVEYVKTGKTAQGKQLSEQEIKAFTDFYALYAKKILNVRFSLYKYIKKDNTELQALKNKAWNTLNSIATNSIATAPQTITKTVIVDPDKELREMFDKKMLEALDAGDMEKYKLFKAERDNLSAPKEVTITETVETSNAQSNTGFSRVQFDDTNNNGVIDFDKPASSSENNNEDSQINFDEVDDESETEW